MLIKQFEAAGRRSFGVACSSHLVETQELCILRLSVMSFVCGFAKDGGELAAGKRSYRLVTGAYLARHR